MLQMGFSKWHVLYLCRPAYGSESFISLAGIIGLTCFYHLSMQTRALGYGVAEVSSFKDAGLLSFYGVARYKALLSCLSARFP